MHAVLGNLLELGPRPKRPNPTLDPRLVAIYLSTIPKKRSEQRDKGTRFQSRQYRELYPRAPVLSMGNPTLALEEP